MNKFRKAVGAVIIKDGKFLLIRKLRDGPHLTKPRWDFSKGGVDKKDKDLKASLMRELYEETKSRKYKIIKQFKEKITFVWNKWSQKKLGFTGQITTMFLV